MKLLNAIMSKTYTAHCGFANFNNFKDALIKYGMDDDIESCQTIHDIKCMLSKNLKRFSEKYEEKAFIQVLLDDVDQLILQNGEESYINEMDLQTTLNKYIKLLEELKIHATPPQLYVVDKFPPPFSNTDWSAFCPDAEDERNYGIPKGIYFLKRYIRPFYSEILLAHEMIHSLCGERNPELFAMGLEEGVAELMGSLYLAGNVLGLDIVSNNFSYTRFNKNANLLWTLYLDHTRQAYLLYKKYGIEILVYMINRGRCEIHSIEKKLISKNSIQFDGNTRTYFEEDFDSMLDYLLLSFTPNYVVTPLQKLLIQEARAGVSISDISNKVQVPENLVREELNKIAFNTSLFMLDGKKIGYSNTELYTKSKEDNFIPVIRYYKEI